MQATNGSKVSPRGRKRLAVYAGAFVLALSGLVFAPAAGATQTTYLALGDSASFGYTEEGFNLHAPNEVPAFFEEGFTNGFAKSLARPSEAGKGVVLINDACPNETVDGAIGHNLPGGGAGAEFDPCPYYQLGGLPLHNSFQTRSQLEEALITLNEGHPTQPVDAVTVSVGMSDELAMIGRCQVEYGAEGLDVVKWCVETEAANEVYPRIIEGIEAALGTVDSSDPGGGAYTGPVILVGYYNPDSFVVPGTDQLLQGLNTALETEVAPKFPNVSFVNPFPTLNKGGERTPQEQAKICKYTEMCNPNVQVAGGEPAGKDGDPNLSIMGQKILAKLVNNAYLASPAR